MTKTEYRAKLSDIAHQRDKITRDNKQPTESQAEELRQLARQTNHYIKEHKYTYQFTPNTRYDELYLLTQYIPRKQLMRIFNYYDSRGQDFVVIPKSLYITRYIQQTRTRAVPKHFKQFGANGYDFSLASLGDILHATTTQDANFQAKHKIAEAKNLKARGKTDCRPWNVHL